MASRDPHTPYSSTYTKPHALRTRFAPALLPAGVTGKELKEAQYINKSLAALGDVMASLDKKSEHIPYRNSKLTYLLQVLYCTNYSCTHVLMNARLI